MSKLSAIYACANCGAQFPKWVGRCSECGSWNTLKPEITEKKTKEIAYPSAEIIDLSKLETGGNKRIITGINEVDRVLGGGIMPGSLVLLSGEPGIGKSTIVAQIASSLDFPVVYVSGEESGSQIKARLDRLGCRLANIKFISETEVEKIIAALNELKPALFIIDSIQTVYTADLEAEAGSLNQIRASAVKFLEIAKQKNIAALLVGHITKDGAIAGPKSLEHIVDTVIYLETEKAHGYRILRATKNRFGSVNELGIFEMAEEGFKEIKNPAAIFLETHEENLSGTAISSVMEGTRPFLVEIQALVSKTVFGYPQRRSSGFDLNRLQVLAAVLTKRANVNLVNQDIIINIAGGLKVSDPAVDLAICTAIISSLTNQTIDRQTIVLGEVGLGGEIRYVPKLSQRLKEAEKLNFNRALLPTQREKITAGKMKLEEIKNLKEILKKLI